MEVKLDVRNIDLRNAQESVEDNVKKMRKTSRKVALTYAGLLGMAYDEAKAIIHHRSGLPRENILMAATHTHSAPAAIGAFQSEPDKEYQRFLALRLADAVLQAINHLEPAKIGWAVESEPRHVFNRRWKMKPGVINTDPFGGTNDLVRMNPSRGSPDLVEPAGPTDPEVPVISVQALDGRPIALLANYSLHYCGGVPTGTVSSDYFGAFCDRMGELLGAAQSKPAFVAIMSNGTSGDCNNINFREPAAPEANFERIQRVAFDVAEAAHRAYQKIEHRGWVPLKAAQKELSLGVRLPSHEEIKKAMQVVKTAEKVQGQLKDRDAIYARETVLMANFPSEVSLILQALRIGEVGIAAIPCEVFVEIGLELKKQSPFKPTFTIELANGYNGYLPTVAQHKLGGYETWRARSSYLEVEAEPKVTRTVLELLEQLK